MVLIAWRFSALMPAGLSMAPSFCHVMEMPPRLRWEPSLWMAVTNFGGLYYLFGRVGGAIDVGGGDGHGGAGFSRSRPSSRVPPHMGAATLMALGLAVWFGFVAPMNRIMAGWTPGVVPDDFTGVRNQWEYAHAVIALIKVTAFASLVLSVLVETKPSA